MAQELNATCDICGKKYTVCASCQDTKAFNPWRTVTDTLPHYMIFLVLSEYTKTKNKEKAKAGLEKCDLSGLEGFNSNIKTVIKDILAEPEIHQETISDNDETVSEQPMPSVKYVNRKHK